MTHFIDRMLADQTVRRKLTNWAVKFACAQGTEPKDAIQACARVCAIWRKEITQEVIDRLEQQQRRIDESCVV